jgi:outer membrane protein assembly factor BamB
MPDTTKPQNWFMYHAGYGHGGNAGDGNPLNSANVKPGQFGLLHSIEVNGSILSVPAIVDGFIYAGLANSHESTGSNGGSLQKYDIATGALINEFKWDIDVKERDTHGFTGMGCTPTVINGFVYFIGFNAKLYCLKQDDLSLVWTTDLRNADPAHNQPVTNTLGTDFPASLGGPWPQAEGWSSPTVVNMQVNGVSSSRVFVGIGEGENPFLFSFIFCLDAANGNVIWIYCTCQYHEGQPNPVNQLPMGVLRGPVPDNFSVFSGQPVTRGCSVWSAIAYDEETGLIYASTGQPASSTNITNFDHGLPSVGWSSGILALKAETGEFFAFTQMPASTSYRPTDSDVDIGSACTIYELPEFYKVLGPTKLVGVGCKNGGFMTCDAKTLQLYNFTSLLPKMNDGTQIQNIDPHPAPAQQGPPFPNIVSNEISNINLGENYFGPFNTAAVYPGDKELPGILFIGVGGPNYHGTAPSIDSTTTPFLKAIRWDTLQDAWPMDNSFDPPRYKNVGSSMYSSPGDSIPGASGLSSPAVVNDVVFVTTCMVAIYAYNAKDGTFLWSEPIGPQTEGFNGGYGYCLGPAIWDKYVVAGALIKSTTGGVLNIYGLK